MASPLAFRERLEQMERTRNERISLLQSEKELQNTQSQLLASRFSNITSIEQRCLKLDRKIASHYFIVSSLKSRLHQLDAHYLQNIQKYRDLRDEVENLEEIEKAKQSYYSLESEEMEKFREQVGNFRVECQVQVEELRSRMNELKTIFSALQGNLNHSNSSEIAANVERSLALNYQLREQLTKQLLSSLMDRSQEKS
ncbi:unnamed protein product [Withania somnifera]